MEGTVDTATHPWEVIIFDVGGTLLDWAQPWENLAATLLGAPHTPEQIRAAAANAGAAIPLPMQSNVEEYLAATSAFWCHILEHIGYTGDFQYVIKHLEDAYISTGRHVFPEVLDVLNHLSRAGQRMAVLSNWSPLLETTLRALGIHDYFEAVICSSIVGHAKPDPLIFHAALSVLNVQPTATLYVGDQLEADILGAQSVGMPAVLLDRSNERNSRDLPDSVHVIPSLIALTSRPCVTEPT